ncbi:MAG: rhodanese-like domain-containing protein, partial [Planctomycetota bacterium]
MLQTFFGTDTLNSAAAFAAALLIGLAFGFALERAGFGSSRRLAGVFYFRDMAVLKVMFTAVITAMLGLAYLVSLGVLPAEQVYFLPTVYGAQIAGGLIFGVGFVMSGWCPGTAAVGLASGRYDAAVFLGGAAIGSILYNELYGVFRPLAEAGDRGVQFVWHDLGVSQPAFILLFTVVGVACFWVAEYVERRRAARLAPVYAISGKYWNSPFLRSFSAALVILVLPLFLLGGMDAAEAAETTNGAVLIGAAAEKTADTAALTASAPPGSTDSALLAGIAAGADHMEPEQLAERLVASDARLLVVDVRTPAEYRTFHIRGAVNVELADLPAYLREQQGGREVVLYSNGMTHPAQARDALARLGFRDVYLLTNGLRGFIERCLKPTSLRLDPVGPELAAKIAGHRSFFLGGTNDAKLQNATDRVAERPVQQEQVQQEAHSTAPARAAGTEPRLVDSDWLVARLGRPDVRIIDVRPQPQYNSGHIPGAVALAPDSVRGVVSGISSMLLPADVLARVFGLMGVTREHTVVLVPDDKLHDATLIGMALERLGHER